MRGDFPGRFTKGIFWFDQGLKPGDSFCFPVLLDDSFCFLSLVFSQREDWNEDDSHPNFVEHVNSSTFVFYSSSFESALNYVCILHGTIVFDIFFINHKAHFHFSSFPTWSHSTHRRIQAWGPTPPTPSSQDARRRPCTAELLQGAKRTSVRIIRTRSPPCPTCLPPCGSRGSWLRRG